MIQLQIKNIFSVIDDYDVFLFDLWGVIVEGTTTYPNVVNNINLLSQKKQVFYISNAPRAAISSYSILMSWGLNLEPSSVITSGEIARSMLINSENVLNIKQPIIYHLGKNRNSDIINDLGLIICEDIKEANILLLTLYRDEGEDLDEFDEILEFAANNNITTICANPDQIIPNLGAMRYCSGYFAYKLEKFGGKVIYTGKPRPLIYDKILQQISSTPKNRILMIGDTLETDIYGANNVGIHSALVLTGNTAKLHQEFQNLEEKARNISLAAYNAGHIPNFIIQLIFSNL